MGCPKHKHLVLPEAQVHQTEKEAFAFLPAGKPSPRPHSPSLYLQAPTELCWQRSNPPCLAASPPHSHIYQCTTRSHLLTLLSRQTQEILRKKNKEKPLKPEKRADPKFWQGDAGFPQFQALSFCYTSWVDFLHWLVLSSALLYSSLSLVVISLLLDQRGQTKGPRVWQMLKVWLKAKKKKPEICTSSSSPTGILIISQLHFDLSCFYTLVIPSSASGKLLHSSPSVQMLLHFITQLSIMLLKEAL